MFPCHCSEEKLKSLEAEHTSCLSELESKGVKILQLESAIDSFQAKILQYEREVAASALKLTSAADQSKETFRLQETLQVLVIFTVLLCFTLWFTSTGTYFSFLCNILVWYWYCNCMSVLVSERKKIKENLHSWGKARLWQKLDEFDWTDTSAHDRHKRFLRRWKRRWRWKWRSCEMPMRRWRTSRTASKLFNI